MIAHVCWKNYEVSRRFAKILLKGLNHINLHNLRPYVACMIQYITIPDEYQPQRIEWLLGMINTRMPTHGNNKKVGVGILNNIQDAIFEYYTTVHKKVDKQREAVLQMIYLYRNGPKYQSASLTLLDGLLNAIVNHDKENKVILKFLLTMQGPGVHCTRYWDWIGPYLRKSIQNQSDNIYQNNSLEFELQCKILSIFDQIESDNKDMMGFDLQSKNLVENGPGGRPLPSPYLIWSLE